MFQASAYDERDIFLYDDKNVTNLTENSGYRNEDPKWSPDGKSIVGLLYFTKWYSSENRHDEIIVYDNNTFRSVAFNSENYDCSDACPIDTGKMIYSSTIGGSYSLYYFDGNESVEIPGVNSDRNELGADFLFYS